MCGRFSLRLEPDEIQDLSAYDVRIGEWIDQDNFVPRYNVAPHSQAPVLRRGDSGTSNSSNEDTDIELKLHTMKWGLVPHWCRFEDKTLNTTNARSENLISGAGMWASIKGRKRCAVLCQGYYEWLTKGKDKLPHFVKHKDGKLMLMAGLYDSVVLDGQTKPLWTFSIVTTAANKEFDWLHERQPVILSTHEALTTWLDTSSQTWTAELTKLVAPYHDASSPLDCYQVPKEVGKVGTESSTFIEPVAKRKDGIQAMFSKQKQTRSQARSQRFSKQASTSTPTKRKRSSSPHSGPKTSPDDDIIVENSSSPAKEPKSTWNEDNEVVLLDGPPSPKKVKANKEESKSPPAPSPSKPKLNLSPKKKTLKPDTSSAKITSFFAKG